MRFAIAIVLLAAATVSPQDQAWACSCAGLNLERQLEVVDYAFAGVVADVDTVDHTYLVATVVVDEVWKGTVVRQFDVWTHIRSSSCGYNDPWARFEIGVKFVLYAFDPDDWIHNVYTHLCTRNQKYDEASKDLAALGPGREPVGSNVNRTPNLNVRLDTAYPNPGRGQIVIPFHLSVPGRLELTIHDILGRVVRTLASGYFTSGYHDVLWDSDRNASGIYFYRMRLRDAVLTRKLILNRD